MNTRTLYRIFFVNAVLLVLAAFAAGQETTDPKTQELSRPVANQGANQPVDIRQNACDNTSDDEAVLDEGGATMGDQERTEIAPRRSANDSGQVVALLEDAESIATLAVAIAVPCAHVPADE